MLNWIFVICCVGLGVGIPGFIIYCLIRYPESRRHPIPPGDNWVSGAGEHHG